MEKAERERVVEQARARVGVLWRARHRCWGARERAHYWVRVVRLHEGGKRKGATLIAAPALGKCRSGIFKSKPGGGSWTMEVLFYIGGTVIVFVIVGFVADFLWR